MSEKWEQRFRFNVQDRNRRKTVTDMIQKMVDIRVKRLRRFEKEVAAQQEKVVATRMDFEEVVKNGGREARSRFLMEAAERNLEEYRKKAERTAKELEILRSNDVEIVETANDVETEEASFAPAPGKNALADKARLWAQQHGVPDFVVSIEIDGKKIDVIDLHAAKDVKTTIKDGKWPAFFSPEPGSDGQERLKRLKALLESASPDMKRMVGILSTPGMQHLIELEAMAVRGQFVEVCEKPEVLEKGLRSLADFEVIDADEYNKNFL